MKQNYEVNYINYCNELNCKLTNLKTYNIYEEIRNVYKTHKVFMENNVIDVYNIKFEDIKLIDIDILNVMGILANKAISEEEAKVWESIFLDIPQIKLSWKYYNMPSIWQFLIKLYYSQVNHKNSFHNVFMIHDDLINTKGISVALKEVKEKRKYYKELISFKKHSNDNIMQLKEAVMLFKPPIAENFDTIVELLKRINYFGYEIVAMKFLSGEYFEKYPDILTNFYKEAYSGYESDSIPSYIMDNIEKIYDTPEFEFFFDEKFSKNMVVPARKLITEYGLTENEINEIWSTSRPDISFEELKKKFSIDSIEIDEDGLTLKKANKRYKVPKNIIDNDNKSIVWFRNNLCFGLNKVGRARTVFPIRDSRIRNGKPTIILNGYVPSLIGLFKEPQEVITIACIIRNSNSKSSSWELLRKCLSGDDDNPRGNCILGSIRKDATIGEIPLNIDPMDKLLLNGLKNIVHLSNGPLEGISEMQSLFKIKIVETAFGELLVKNGYKEQCIQHLLTNPKVVLQNNIDINNDKSVFELTSKKEPKEALTIIQTYFPLS